MPNFPTVRDKMAFVIRWIYEKLATLGHLHVETNDLFLLLQTTVGEGTWPRERSGQETCMEQVKE